MGQFRAEVLSDEEIDQLLEATFTLMETVGVRIHAERAVQLLKDAGCEVDGNMVRIPRGLVMRCVKSAPSKVEIYDRDGNLAMDLSGTNSYFGPGVTCPNCYDPITQERIQSTKQFVCDVARVADAIDDIDYIMALGMVEDITPLKADIQELHAMLLNSSKPILTWTFNKENLATMIDMAEIAVGGAEQLKAKPYMIVYAEPTTPLVHTKEAMEKIMLLAERSVPCVYSPGMTLGGTAPVTLAGACTVALSDSLTGLVVSQLVNPGAPIILGSNGGVLDMTTLQAPYGCPEMCLLEACGTQALRYLGVPTFGLAGATDSKAMDMQAADDVMMQVICSIGTGANLVHDLGMIDIGMTASIHYLVASAEIVAAARRLRRGVTLDEAHFALDVIKEVGPGGNFVAEEHTVEFLREELYAPEMSIRTTYDAWEKGGKKNFVDRAYDKTVDLLKTYKPKPLEEEKLVKLQAIMETVK